MVDVDPRGDLEPRSEARREADRRRQPTAVVVAGMHRSGTSALARVLSLLGLDLPKTIYEAREDNPLGYWEPEPVIEAHEEFLAEVGSSMDDVLAFGDTALRGPAARKLEDRLVEILGQEFDGSAGFVVKDPRICRVIPVWVAALTRFGADPRFVLPIRNPLEVAASLKIRNEYSTTKSLLLWLRHVLEAEQHTRNLPRSIISYEELLRDWQAVVDKVGHELGVVWPRTSHTAYAEIEQFLSPRQRHHEAELSELDARADVVDWVKATYEVLAAAAAGDPLEREVLDGIRREFDRADRAFGPLVADMRLAAGAQQERLTEETARTERLREELKAAREDTEHVRAKLADLQAHANQQALDLADRNRAAAEAAAEANRFRAKLSFSERDADRLRAKLTDLEAGAARQALELADRDRAAAEAETAAERLSDELARAQEEIAAATGRADSLAGELEGHTRELTDAATEARQLDEMLRAALAERDALQRANAEAHAALASLRAELASLQAEAKRQGEELSRRDEASRRAHSEIDRLAGELAKREVVLGRLQRPLSVRLRAKLLSTSMLLSWLVRPHRQGWRHFAEFRHLRRANTFDAAAYLVANPDVRALGVNPVMHYIAHGAREGRALQPAPAPAPPPAIAPPPAEPEPIPVAPAAETESAPPAAPPTVTVVTPRVVPATPGPVPPADYSDFVVLLSRQRSGTNALRSVLDTHPDVFCFNEVFNLPDRDADDELLRESNFFTFVERYAGGDIRKTLPDNHERLFLDFLDYLRCLSDKRYALIDIKYNMTQLLVPTWHRPGTPYLFDLIARHRLRVLNVTRRNYLRWFLSVKKANDSGVYSVDRSKSTYADQAIHLPAAYTVREMTTCAEEDELITRYLGPVDEALRLEFEYAELFPGGAVVVDPDHLARFSAWLDIPNEFELEPEYRKQSSLPLSEAIENYDEIAAALRDTPLAYCLEDEPAYRAAAAGS